MKASIAKGLIASAAAFAIGAFAQVQTGTPSNGSQLGVTPPPSTSVTTDTSRLATDCDKVAADQRSNQAGGAQVNAMTGCNHREAMGAAATATPAVVGSNSSATTASPSPMPSNDTAMSKGSSSTHVASNDMHPKRKAHKARKAKADRG